jgi:hypothetical protein
MTVPPGSQIVLLRRPLGAVLQSGNSAGPREQTPRARSTDDIAGSTDYITGQKLRTVRDMILTSSHSEQCSIYRDRKSMRAIPASAAAVLPRHPPPVRAGDAGVGNVIRYQVQMFR